jgi:hypothetical protein
METTKAVHKSKESNSSPSLAAFELQITSFAHSKLKYMKEGSLLARRKGSFPELGIVPMTTVQEHSMDSRKLLHMTVTWFWDD